MEIYCIIRKLHLDSHLFSSGKCVCSRVYSSFNYFVQVYGCGTFTNCRGNIE